MWHDTVRHHSHIFYSRHLHSPLYCMISTIYVNCTKIFYRLDLKFNVRQLIYNYSIILPVERILADVLY